MKNYGHSVQHHDFFLDECLGEYLLLFPKLLKKLKELKLMCLQHASWSCAACKDKASGEVERVPLSANRGSGRPLSNRTELMLEDGVRELVDDLPQASAGQSAGSSTITSLTSRIERQQLFLKPKKKKKPPGLSQEALDYLHLEVFSSKVKGRYQELLGIVVCVWRCAYKLAMFP
nr:gamma-tubulin complex component 2 [Quercus suber]